MRLRKLGPGFDPGVVLEIDKRLRDTGVRILLAVESGSRAWGFSSPDSDYDCRFIYARQRDDYLSLYGDRDVIEYPPDAVFDVNGWDLAKALKLLLKSNAVVVEWLTSPWIYDGDSQFREEMLALARQVLRPDAVARHYLHLGERQRRTYFADANIVPLKKVFYALRPAMALRWLRLHSDVVVAPMEFRLLANESDLPTAVGAIVDDLLIRKAQSRELGEGRLPISIRDLIDSEFELARSKWSARGGAPTEAARAAADAFFRRWISP